MPERDALPPVESIRSVHFVAIAGTGMGSLACMLADRGLSVTGSDQDVYPPMSDQLEAAGIEVLKGFGAEHIAETNPDLVVIGNACRRDNAEARAAIDGGVPFTSFPDAVYHFFLRGKHPIVVTGTHGKTTATALIAWVLTHAGLDPGVLVGGVAVNFGGSFRNGAGEPFVVEGDEYDTAFFDKTPKFLHYAARTAMLTSCEFDHGDIYASLDAIKAQFRQLVLAMPPDGRIIAATDSEAVRELVSGAPCPVEGYGFREPALWRTTDVTFDEHATGFTVWRGETRLCRVRMPMHGRHNVENALGAIAVAAGVGVEPEAAAAALAEFAGIKRRQEVRGEAAGVVVLDDFAHHPTAVRETIAAVRTRYPDRTLWAIFEPRTNTSRRNLFQADYTGALAGADRVVIADVYRAADIPEAERLDPAAIAAAINAGDGKSVAVNLPNVEAIVEEVASKHRGHDVCLIMSNGAFDGIWDRLLARLAG